MVFQNYALYPHMTVRENIGFALKLPEDAEGPRSTQQRRRGGRRSSSSSDLLDRKPRSSRAASASGSRWAGRSSAIRRSFLMDEPLSNLDAKLRVQMRAEIAAAPAAARDDDGLRHARPGRGDDARRPRRRHARRATSSRSTRPQTALRPTGRTCSWRGSSAARDELRGAPAGGGGAAAAVRRRAETRAAIDAKHREVVAGIRPEHFDDGALSPSGGLRFRARPERRRVARAWSCSRMSRSVRPRCMPPGWTSSRVTQETDEVPGASGRVAARLATVRPRPSRRGAGSRPRSRADLPAVVRRGVRTAPGTARTLRRRPAGISSPAGDHGAVPAASAGGGGRRHVDDPLRYRRCGEPAPRRTL